MDLSLEECGLRRCDEAAMKMLHHLCRGPSAEAAVTLAAWLDNVEDRAPRAGTVTTLEYLVVLALLREQALEIASPPVADRRSQRC